MVNTNNFRKTLPYDMANVNLSRSHDQADGWQRKTNSELAPGGLKCDDSIQERMWTTLQQCSQRCQHPPRRMCSLHWRHYNQLSCVIVSSLTLAMWYHLLLGPSAKARHVVVHDHAHQAETRETRAVIPPPHLLPSTVPGMDRHGPMSSHNSTNSTTTKSSDGYTENS